MIAVNSSDELGTILECGPTLDIEFCQYCSDGESNEPCVYCDGIENELDDQGQDVLWDEYNRIEDGLAGLLGLERSLRITIPPDIEAHFKQIADYFRSEMTDIVEIDKAQYSGDLILN